MSPSDEHRSLSSLAHAAGQCGPRPCYLQGTHAVWLTDRLLALRRQHRLRMRDVIARAGHIDSRPSFTSYDAWESASQRRRPVPFSSLGVLAHVLQTSVHDLLHGLPYAEEAYMVWMHGGGPVDWTGWCAVQRDAVRVLMAAGVPVVQPQDRALRRDGPIKIPAETPAHLRKKWAVDAPPRPPKPPAPPAPPVPTPLPSPGGWSESAYQVRHTPLMQRWGLVTETPEPPPPRPVLMSPSPFPPPHPVEGYNAERRARGVWLLRCRSCGTAHEQPLGQRAPRTCDACGAPLSAARAS